MKKIVIEICLLLLTLQFFAQTSAQENQIELPDLMTLVSGTGEDQDLAPAPDFDDVLDMAYNSGDLVPQLPSVSVTDEAEVNVEGAQLSQKDIYAEGEIGGGYPASFTGDFQIARLYGADPFKISFNHESASGFAGH